MQGCWRTRIPGCWIPGMMAFWDHGMRISRDGRMLGSYHAGMLEVLKFWDGIPRPWDYGIRICWDQRMLRVLDVEIPEDPAILGCWDSRNAGYWDHLFCLFVYISIKDGYAEYLFYRESVFKNHLRHNILWSFRIPCTLRMAVEYLLQWWILKGTLAIELYKGWT